MDRFTVKVEDAEIKCSRVFDKLGLISKTRSPAGEVEVLQLLHLIDLTDPPGNQAVGLGSLSNEVSWAIHLYSLEEKLRGAWYFSSSGKIMDIDISNPTEKVELYPEEGTFVHPQLVIRHLTRSEASGLIYDSLEKQLRILSQRSPQFKTELDNLALDLKKTLS